MTGEQLQELLCRGCDDPAQALVQLWATLQQRGLLQRACRARAKKDPDAYVQRAQQLLSFLRGGEAPSHFKAADAYAVLSALDQEMYSRYSGYQLNPQRIELNDSNEAYWLLQRPSGWYSKHVARQANYPAYWMPRHHIVPALHREYRLEVVSGRDSSVMRERLAECVQRGVLRVGVASFADGVMADWPGRHEGTYQTDRLLDPALRWESTEGVLQAASESGVHVLVMPELAVCLDTRRRVARWLCRHRRQHGLIAVMPGSFHVRRNANCHNEAVLLEERGFCVLKHHKLMSMLLLPQAVAKAKRVNELIDEGDTLQLLATPVGLLAMAICLDFCDHEGESPVGDLWRLSGTRFVLVASMGNHNTCKAHARRASKLRNLHSTVTAMANQKTDKRASHGFIVKPSGEHHVTAEEHLTIPPAGTGAVVARWGYVDVELSLKAQES